MGTMADQLGQDKNKVGSAVTAALPLILGALSKNASRDDGAQSLSNALSKDHDGSILDNLGGFLGNAESGPGNGILGHVFGSKRQRVESSLSKSSGLDAGSVSKLMVMLAPVVMGFLGKKQRQEKMNASSLSGLLGQERETMNRQMPKQMGGMSQLLDTDGDGDVDLSDLIKGAGGLGKLFGGR